MSARNIRILADAALPSKTLRFYDGSGGAFVDLDGNTYWGAELRDNALDQIEAAINAEAFTLSLALSGIDEDTSNAVWEDYQAGNIVGSRFRVMLQKLDRFHQPVGQPLTKFTGTISNLQFLDQVANDNVLSAISVDIANRFTLRTVTSGAVLSDPDQRARARVLNPFAPDDRSCERIPAMKDKTIRWPNW